MEVKSEFLIYVSCSLINEERQLFYYYYAFLLWAYAHSSSEGIRSRLTSPNWERARGEGGGGWLPSQTGKQPCDHPCGCPDRQHALLPLSLQVSEVRSARAFQRSRRRHSRRLSVESGSCCLSEDPSVTLDPGWSAPSEPRLLQREVFHMC